MANSRFAQVRGFADQMPRTHTDPMDPSNRRVSLIVQWVEVPGGGAVVAEGDKPEPQGGSELGAGGEKAPASAGAVKAGAGGASSAAAAVSGTPPASASGTPAASAAKAPVSAAPAAAKPSAMVAKPGVLDRLTQMMPGKQK
jgi:chemotaxis protein MotB